jgi:hypothetical protein
MTDPYDQQMHDEGTWRIDFGVHHRLRSNEAQNFTAHRSTQWGRSTVSWPHTASNPTPIGWSYPGGQTEQK